MIIVLDTSIRSIRFSYRMIVVSFNSNTTGITCEAGTAYPPPGLSEVRVAPSLVFCVMFCRSLFVIFLLAIVLSVLLRLKISVYLFGNSKRFFFRFHILVVRRQDKYVFSKY